MKRYEYKIVTTENAEKTLNEYGADGWRCNRIHHMTPLAVKLYLEREIEIEEVDIRKVKDEE